MANLSLNFLSPLIAIHSSRQTQLSSFNYAFSSGGPVITERRGAQHSRNTIIPVRKAVGEEVACLCLCMLVHACQSTSMFFGILISAVHRPPIVSSDPLSRFLPKELYLPLLVITAHKEQHVKNMSYLSACFYGNIKQAANRV